MRRSGRAHWVRPNHGERRPRSFVYLDTEAHRTPVGRGEVQTFRLAVAAYDTINKHTRGPVARRWHRATTSVDLWEWITARCAVDRRTVLVAHNLAYDVRISEMFTHLPALGWTFKAGRVDDGRAWMTWANGTRTLVCVDSLSWVPVSLETLGDAVGMPKLAPPDEADDDEAWFDRCTRDVEILADVWGRLMVWVESECLGDWRFTGAGQAWAAFRHRWMNYRLLVHEDDDARAAERAAAMAGRCEAWQHGRLTAGPYTEWDFTTAYARIGVECDVPVVLCGEMYGPTLEKVTTLPRSRVALIECEVTTDVPTCPYRDRDGIRWPVGTFRTSLWGNEVAVALAHGATVRVERAWVYRTAPALRAFCTWVLDGLDGTRGEVDPVVRVALKHWSRALIGRTASRTSRWEPWGEAPRSAVNVGPVHDVDAGERYRMMQLGTALFRETERRESPDAMVAVMSFVMAESRCRLWAAMRVAGLDTVAYVDTDSLIVDAAGSERLRVAGIDGLRIKGVWSEVEVMGPRQVLPGATLRASGIPRGAVRTGRHTWRAEVWSGLMSSLARGEADRVTIAERTFRLKGRDRRRRHLPGGRTSPFEVVAETLRGAVSV